VVAMVINRNVDMIALIVDGIMLAQVIIHVIQTVVQMVVDFKRRI
jgi:hypothetical protein